MSDMKDENIIILYQCSVTVDSIVKSDVLAYRQCLFSYYIFTHVYVLQKLKALSEEENEATILLWTLWEIRYTPTAPKCSDR